MYAQEHYGVPACLGRRVIVDGKPGTIAQDRGQYIGVNFDHDKPGVIRNAHPTWRVQYEGMGKVRPMTRAQRRYRHWLVLRDSFKNFRDFLQHEAARTNGAHHE